MDILEFIPKGKENAIRRSDLVSMTGLSDRIVRETIAKINASGKSLICCEAGEGYFLPETKEEAERYIRYSRSYLITLAKKDRAMRRAVRKMFSDQIEMGL